MKKTLRKHKKAFDDADRKVDEFFDTTAKIFGGLVFSEDLSETSRVLQQWYQVRGLIIESEKELRINELAIDAMEENNDTASRRYTKAQENAKAAREKTYRFK